MNLIQSRQLTHLLIKQIKEKKKKLFSKFIDLMRKVFFDKILFKISFGRLDKFVQYVFGIIREIFKKYDALGPNRLKGLILKFQIGIYFTRTKNHQDGIKQHFEVCSFILLQIFDKISFETDQNTLRVYEWDLQVISLAKEVLNKINIRMFYKNQILTLSKNRKQIDMITQIDHSVSFSPVKILQPTILQGPTKEHLKSLGLFYHPYQNTTFIFESEQINFKGQDQKDEQTSHDSDNLLNQNKNIQLAAMVSSENINSQGQEKRKRKNKAETKQLISENQKDQGRGGNCIASNITKTLLRIVQSRLSSKVYDEFKNLIDSYKIKSQKENTIILLLLLFVFSSQGKIHLDQFQQVFSQFLKSLLQSKNNCEKKMQEEVQRKGFHLKNKKMYVKFIELNTDLYKKLSMRLEHNSSSEFSLKMIEEMISDTYDRKQREIEKAMNKIKSIISNHKELIQLFNYDSDQVEEAFEQSIDYAFRRNLPKRCKSVKTSIRNFFVSFKRHINVKSDQDKYFMCFLSLILIDQKKKEIWEEFIKNITMKKQFNKDGNQLKQLQQYLKSELSNILDRLQTDQKNSMLVQEEKQYKMEEEQPSKLQQNFTTLFKVFVDLRIQLQN